MEAAVRLEHDLIAVETEQEVHAMLELAVPEPAEAGARPALSLALVLDRSGSMDGRKLEVAKRAAAWLVDRLRPEDRVALVAYDSRVRLLAPLGPPDPATLVPAIGSLYAGSTTNLSGGWLRGQAELERADGDGVRKVLLLSDGLANEGITDPARLVGLATGARGRGIGTTTIGFGDDFDEELMTQMADAGGGNAHYADTPDAVPGIFAEELEGLTRLVAQNVTLEIRPAPVVDSFSILNAYPQVPVQGGVQVELGDAYGGERRRVVFGLHVPALQELGVVKAADLVLRYVTVGEEIEQRTLTLPLLLNLVSADEAATREPDLAVREEVLRLATASARATAIELADEGRYEEAQQVLRQTAADVRAKAPALGAKAAQALAAEADALDADLARVAPVAYSLPASRKGLHYAAHRRRRGR